VARSMDISAVVGAREASRIVTQGRLDHHRRRCWCRHRESVSHRVGGVTVPPAPGRARARPARPPAEHASRYAGRAGCRAPGKHRASDGRAGCSRRGGDWRGPVPQ
jgi:hypothetical protein